MFQLTSIHPTNSVEALHARSYYQMYHYSTISRLKRRKYNTYLLHNLQQPPGQSYKSRRIVDIEQHFYIVHTCSFFNGNETTFYTGFDIYTLRRLTAHMISFILKFHSFDLFWICYNTTCCCTNSRQQIEPLGFEHYYSKLTA